MRKLLRLLQVPFGLVAIVSFPRLYRFVRDKTSNDANGEGINAFGGTWQVATPSLAAS